MRAVLAALALGVLATSCAATGPGGDAWARAIFAPSQNASAAVCERAHRTGAAQGGISEILKTKAYTLSGKRGEVTLQQGLALVRLLCGFVGSIGGPVPSAAEFGSFGTSILIEDAQFDRKTAKLRVELEGEKGVSLGRLEPTGTSDEDDKHWFNFDKLGAADTARLDAAVAFVVVLERGLGEERFRVTASEYAGINAAPQGRGTYAY